MKDWNDTVLEHPELKPTDKLVYHLLVRFGSDDLSVRRQIAELLQRSERHIRRVCARLRQHGFTVDDLVLEEAVDNSAVMDADSSVPAVSVDNFALADAVDDSVLAENVDNWAPADTYVRNTGHGCPERTPMSETDTHVRGNGHPCPARTPTSEMRTPMSDPLTRARTSRSSSNEEDSSCTAVPPSSPSSPPLGEGRGKEGGGGGNIPEEEQERKKPPSEYLSEMQSWWDDIWPDNLEEDHPWFGQLWREFGLEIPVQVLRQFAEMGRTLTDLDYPECYQRYFLSCCRNALKQRSTLRKPSPSDAAYNPDLKVLYVADRERRGSELNRIEAKIKALCREDRDDIAYDDYEQTLRAPYRAERRGP